MVTLCHVILVGEPYFTKGLRDRGPAIPGSCCWSDDCVQPGQVRVSETLCSAWARGCKQARGWSASVSYSAKGFAQGLGLVLRS